ncbi:ABC transporter permease [Fulvivirgaceae bacterium BMA10]|uniref:ABC transporter permease n=1 Tax=Splendidivirga corallicola TaxID=3051826 RepID=A0ABT8KWA5_9BACT|nr:ABC transporter permease [Fulvivirgaceae bacterium BMA10]
MKHHKKIPPKLADRFLSWFCKGELLEEIQGDLHEYYEELVDKPKWKRNLLYWFHVLNFLRPFAIKKSRSYNSDHSAMLRHNFVISIRKLKRNKTYTAINVFGLTVGIACVIVIFILVRYHLSFDTFHTNSERIYRVITELHQEDINYVRGVPSPLGEAIRSDFTFAEEVAMVTFLNDRLISIPSFEGEKKFKETIVFAEPAFFNILNFPLVRGNKNTILKEPNTAIVTERIAKKYFGEEEPIGQTIQIDNKLNLIITGILKDLPINTDRQQEIYIPYSGIKDHSPWLDHKAWWFSVNQFRQCFVLPKSDVSLVEIDEALSAISEKYYDERNSKIFQFKLQHLSDIHFNPDLGGYIERKNLWALAFIGFFMIITSCVNFINLATAQALGRSREIGVKKVLGGLRGQLFWQFITETTLISALAIGLAVGLAYFALPFVNQLFDTRLGIDLLRDTYLLTFLSMLLFVVIFFSGSYPGLMLAGFKPVRALKSNLTQKHIGGFSLRRGLIIVQFAISQLLLIGAIVIANQMRYTQQADMGFEKEAVIMLPLHGDKTSKKSILHTRFSRIAGVEQVTFCDAAPASEFTPNTNIRVDSRAEDENFSIHYRTGDQNYVPLFGLQIVEGRNLHPSDTIREYLINEATVKRLGIISNQDAIGKKIFINGKKGTIVGVVKDFHFRSFHETIDPLCITTWSDTYVNCAVKINLTNLKSTLEALEKNWNEVYPDQIYEYDFLDERIARFYEQDNIMLWLIQVFAAIAIVIGCLGLYGLVSFMIAHKTKEVGVRKVLGASIKSILWIFGKEFTRLLIIAFIVAAPFGWWVMNSWLENFAYRIEIGTNTFAIALVVTFLVAIVTVGYHAIKAALANPTQCLRNE